MLVQGAILQCEPWRAPEPIRMFDACSDSDQSEQQADNIHLQHQVLIIAHGSLPGAILLVASL
jgi:hypothetical protein